MEESSFFHAFSQIIPWLGIFLAFGQAFIQIGNGLEGWSAKSESTSVKLLTATVKLDRKIFGKNLLSARSVIISILISILVSCYFCLFIPFYSNYEHISVNSRGTLALHFFLWVWVMSCNAIFDVLSVLTTRFILRRIKNTKSTSTLLFFMLIDLLILIILAVVPFTIVLHFTSLVLLKSFDLMVFISFEFYPYKLFPSDEISEWGFFKFLGSGYILLSCLISSAATSIWIYIYCLGLWTSSLIAKTGKPVERLRGLLVLTGYGLLLICIFWFVVACSGLM